MSGGDLYDWFGLRDGQFHVTVVDVLGHGVTSTRDALLVTPRRPNVGPRGGTISAT